MHTIYRFASSLLAALFWIAVFGAWGLVASLAAGNLGPLIAVEAFVIIFFAPVAFANRWADIGD